MHQLQPHYFFNLSFYSHKDLFKGEKVWEALTHISTYLQSFPLLGKHNGLIDPRAYLVNPEHIFIGKGTIVEPGAFIQGPCIIGDNCEIRHGAYIRGNTIIGNECVIGHTTEIKHSIFLDGAKASHFAYIGDCILGNKVNLGAGTKCANLKLDRTLISILCENKKYETGLKKLGAILGDNVQIGCNSVTNPGTLMGKKCLCYPCVHVGGFIPESRVIKSPKSAMIEPI